MNRTQRRHQQNPAPGRFYANHAINAVLEQAAQLHQAGQLQDAEITYRQVLERQPNNPDALRLLALLAHQLGKHDIAAGYLHQASVSRPHDAQIPTDLGYVHLSLGGHRAAERSFRRALTVNPGKAPAHLGLGNALYALGNFEEAVASHRDALAADPLLLDAWINLGNALQATGQLEDALNAYLKALTLAPDNADARSNAGVVLRRMGRLDEALQQYRAALSGDPRQYDVLCNFGNTLHEATQYAQAADIFRAATTLEPERATAHSGLANVLVNLFRPDDALSAAAAALAIAPNDHGALNSQATAAWMAGEPEQAEAGYRRLQALDPAAGYDITTATLLPMIAPSHRGMVAARKRYSNGMNGLGQGLAIARPLEQARTSGYLPYQGRNDRDLQCQLAQAYLQRIPSLEFTASHCTAGTAPNIKHGKVRVGFASKFLSDHTVGRLTQGLIEHLDRERFEVSVIHLRGAQDGASAAMDATADHALELNGSLPEMQQQIAALELDALIYPEIGMDAQAYFLAFARLAPVQCVLWGHPVTTGIPNVDHFISSKLVEPAGAQRHYSERLVALKRLPVHYPRPELPDVSLTRESFGFTAADHVYLCPQSLFKLHPDFDPVLAAVLRRDPAGRLVLLEGMSTHWAALLRQRFARTMPDVAERVMFLPRLDRAKFLALLRASDVMLDPLHFGGGNSTYEALGSGVPIVTLPGGFMRSRVTAGCYLQMGMTDLIAADEADYAEKAVRLANDGTWRAAMAQKITALSPALFEDDDAVRELEGFLLVATGREAQSFDGRDPWAA